MKTATALDKAILETAHNHYLPAGKTPVCWQGGIRHWLRKLEPDIVVMEANPRLLSNRFAIRWMRRRGRPVLGWGLGEMSRRGSTWSVWARQVFAANFLRRLDGIIAYSKKAAQIYSDIGFNTDRIFVAHNAVDDSQSELFLSQLGSELSWLRPWKDRLCISGDSPIVLFVGRLLEQKRVDLLIDACAPLFPRCRLLIVGDGPHLPALRERGERHAEHIRFTGPLAGRDLAKCFIAADLFVLPGLGGLALHQAMSYGKAVLASLADGTESDLIQEGVNGMFFKPGDIEDLRRTISLLLDDKEKLSKMGEASLSMTRQTMSLNAMVEAFHNALIRTAALHC